MLHKKIKVEILDHYENTLGEITQDIDGSNNGSININYNQGIRRTCNFNIRDINGDYLPNSEDSPFFINRKFKISLGLIVDKDIYWWSQGTYITKSVDTKRNSVSISAVDKFNFFRSGLQSTYVIPAGSNAVNVIKDIIALDIGNGYPIDPIEPIIDTEFYNETLPYDIQKNRGESLGDILIEIATALGADIYYDALGQLIVTKSITDSYRNFAPIWDFTDVESEYIEPSISYSMEDIENVITVCGNNTTGIIYDYTAKNEYPMSPLRVSRIGEYFKNVVEIATGYTEQRCKEYAEYLLKKKTLLSLQGNFSTPFIPHLDVDKIISITDKYFKFNQTHFIIQEITLPFGTGMMGISVCNMNYLPFSDDGNGGFMP